MTDVPVPDPDPAFLYRYVGVSGGRADYLHDTLTNNRLYLASPKAFNDPFDLSTEANTLARTFGIRPMCG